MVVANEEDLYDKVQQRKIILKAPKDVKIDPIKTEFQNLEKILFSEEEDFEIQ